MTASKVVTVCTVAFAATFGALVAAAYLIVAGQVILTARRRRRAEYRPGVWHNMVAHPLLVLVSPLGEWMHHRTRPTVPTLRRRWRDRRRPRGGGPPVN